MDEQRRLKIVKLAQAESRARSTYEAMSRVNCHGLSQDQQALLDGQYALARAQWYEALKALQEAVGEPIARAQPSSRPRLWEYLHGEEPHPLPWFARGFPGF